MSSPRILVRAAAKPRSPSRLGFVLLALVGLLVFCGPALAYLPPGSGWESMDQEPYTFLCGVAFSDATHGWAVGQDYDASATPSYFGAIAATTDGAATWTDQAPGTTAVLLAVATTDATHAWAVGLDGTIVATSNGSTWSPQTSGTAQTLNAVAFPDAAHGWAVGDDGVIRVTSNGGADWGGQVSGTTYDISCVTFPEGDTTNGWVVAYDYGAATSKVIGTTNGGGTWTEKLSVTGEITSISFPDALHGWAVTFNGLLYYTVRRRQHVGPPPDDLRRQPPRRDRVRRCDARVDDRRHRDRALGHVHLGHRGRRRDLDAPEQGRRPGTGHGRHRLPRPVARLRGR